MSRDQRPRRERLIDSDPFENDLKPRAAGPDAGAVAAQPAPPAAPKSRTLLWGLLFLLACVAGAVGLSLLSRAGLS